MNNVGRRGPGHPNKYWMFIEHLPYQELSPNRRVHWSQKSKATKSFRTEGFALGRELVDFIHRSGRHTPPFNHIRVGYLFSLPDRRRRDMDNLVAMMKPFIDGLVDSGLVVDDDHQHVSYDLHEATYAPECKSAHGAVFVYVEILD